MNEEQKRMAEKILETLESARFNAFSNGALDDFISGCPDAAPTREVMIQKIVQLFRL